MYTRQELEEIDRRYFEVIIADEYDVILMSRNTRHVWYLRNVELPDGEVTVILHKHQVSDLILSRLVDTFISRISLTMLPVPNPHNTVCVLSWEEARHWQSRSSGYSSS